MLFFDGISNLPIIPSPVRHDRKRATAFSPSGDDRIVVGLVVNHQKVGEDMETVLRCVKCDRPAQLKAKSTGRTRNGNLNVKKVYERVCPCGGEIKPMMG